MKKAGEIFFLKNYYTLRYTKKNTFNKHQKHGEKRIYIEKREAGSSI
jgi:hypothetical protein